MQHTQGYEALRDEIDADIDAAQHRAVTSIERFMRETIEQYARDARLRQGTVIEFTDAMGSWSISIKHGRREYKLIDGSVSAEGIGLYHEDGLKRVLGPLLQLLEDYAWLCDTARNVAIDPIKVTVAPKQDEHAWVVEVMESVSPRNQKRPFYCWVNRRALRNTRSNIRWFKTHEAAEAAGVRYANSHGYIGVDKNGRAL